MTRRVSLGWAFAWFLRPSLTHSSMTLSALLYGRTPFHSTRRLSRWSWACGIEPKLQGDFILLHQSTSNPTLHERLDRELGDKLPNDKTPVETIIKTLGNHSVVYQKLNHRSFSANNYDSSREGTGQWVQDSKVFVQEDGRAPGAVLQRHGDYEFECVRDLRDWGVDVSPQWVRGERHLLSLHVEILECSFFFYSRYRNPVAILKTFGCLAAAGLLNEWIHI